MNNYNVGGKEVKKGKPLYRENTPKFRKGTKQDSFAVY